MRKILFTLLILLLLGEAYTFILIRSSLRPMNRWWKKALFSFYILVTLFTWGCLFMFRSLLMGDLSHLARNIFLAFLLGFMLGKIVIAILMLMDDLRRILLWMVFKLFPKTKRKISSSSHDIPRSLFIKRMALITGGSMLGGLLYGMSNRYNYQVRNIKLNFKNLPASFRGLRILQISDIHAGSFDSHESVEKGVLKIMEQKPDIIFFTGDLVNNKAEEFNPYIELFSRLKAPLGIYSTLGNHDYGDYIKWESPMAKAANLEELKRMHAQMNWKLMMNEHVILQRGEESIAVIGVENWGGRANFPKYGDLKKACNGLEEKNIPFKILLSHDPSHWDHQVTKEFKDIDLTLSGHTHGMQFGIEIPGLNWSPVQYLYKNWAGLAKENEQHLYVNRGYGFLGYPGRLGIMPEITVIELS